MGEANVAESLALLRGPASAIKDGILNGEYALWLGSGISFGRMPGLTELIFLLLKALWDKSPDPSSPYRLKFKEIVGKAPGLVNDSVDPATWVNPNRETFLKQLVPKYAEIFGDQVIVNNVPEQLSKDILDIPPIYNDATQQPDAEHAFVNALIRESIVTDIVTTNWDPLMERADEASRGTHPAALKVIACAEDFPAPSKDALATLLKIHGCARGCCLNRPKYWPYFIVTTLDLGRWNSEAIFSGFKTKTSSLLTGQPALFVGLSAQDFNLLQVIIDANRNSIAFDVARPRLAFAPNLGTSETTALKATYGDQVYTANYAKIAETANVKLYGKPLFGAIYLLTLFEKAKVMVRRVGASFTKHHTDLVDEALATIETCLTQRYDAIANHDQRWRLLSDDVRGFLSRFLRLYRHQKVPADAAEYDSVCESSIPRLRTDENISLAVSWAIMAVAVCLRGKSDGIWNISIPTDRAGEHGHLLLTMKSGATLTLFFGEHTVAQAVLLAEGFIGTGAPGRIAIIYPSERLPHKTPLTPATVYPGTASGADPKEIEFKSLLESSGTIGQLVDALRQEFL